MADLFIVGVAPIDYSPILLLRLFGFRIAPDTLSSIGLRRWPARNYPCLRIQRPSSERWSDFNPPDSCATQHTLRPSPTPAVTAAYCDVEAATLVGSPPITRTTFPTCRAHYPGGSSGCAYRLLPTLIGAFPNWQEGRHPRCHFRGLLKLHSRYGPSVRSAAQRRPLSRGSSPASYPAKPLASFRTYRQLSG